MISLRNNFELADWLILIGGIIFACIDFYALSNGYFPFKSVKVFMEESLFFYWFLVVACGLVSAGCIVSSLFVFNKNTVKNLS